MEETSPPDDLESGRLARFFLFKHRDRTCVKRSQIKTVLDKGNDEKNKETNAIEKSKTILETTMGLTVQGYVPSSKKTPQKYYVTRNFQYSDEQPIPFSETEKKIFGILTYVFLTIYYRHPDLPTFHEIQTQISSANLEDDIRENGFEFAALFKSWMQQEYLVEIKGESNQEPTYTFGPRFEIEIGRENLEKFINKILIPESTE